MKILLVNVDARFNIAIRKMYTYFKSKAYVEMIDLGLTAYPKCKHKIVDATGFDKVYASNIFEINQNRFRIIGCEDVTFGGVGSVNSDLKLPLDIENAEIYYFEHEDTSYGFITRGCIRNCWFCKVPEHEGKLRFYNSIEQIVRHKKVKFLDNNILAYKDHLSILKKLVDMQIKCDFNQGLDFRLITEENASLLSQLNYDGEYKFAFDSLEYKDAIEEKMCILKKHLKKDWTLKFYIYHNKNMDLSSLIERVEWCRKNKCLPYVMRDSNCWESEYKNFLIDYAAYCNQPAFFKKLTFNEFIKKRTKNISRISCSTNIYKTYSLD